MHLSNITDQSDTSQTVFGLHEGMRTITQVDLKILLNGIMAGSDGPHDRNILKAFVYTRTLPCILLLQ